MSVFLWSHCSSVQRGSRPRFYAYSNLLHHRQSAAHADSLAGDVAAPVGREECECCRDLARAAGPFEWNLLDGALDEFGAHVALAAHRILAPVFR